MHCIAVQYECIVSYVQQNKLVGMYIDSPGADWDIAESHAQAFFVSLYFLYVFALINWHIFANAITKPFSLLWNMIWNNLFLRKKSPHHIQRQRKNYGRILLGRDAIQRL